MLLLSKRKKRLEPATGSKRKPKKVSAAAKKQLSAAVLAIVKAKEAKARAASAVVFGEVHAKQAAAAALLLLHCKLSCTARQPLRKKGIVNCMYNKQRHDRLRNTNTWVQAHAKEQDAQLKFCKKLVTLCIGNVDIVKKYHQLHGKQQEQHSKHLKAQANTCPGTCGMCSATRICCATLSRTVASSACCSPRASLNMPLVPCSQSAAAALCTFASKPQCCYICSRGIEHRWSTADSLDICLLALAAVQPLYVCCCHAHKFFKLLHCAQQQHLLDHVSVQKLQWHDVCVLTLGPDIACIHCKEVLALALVLDDARDKPAAEVKCIRTAELL